MTATFLAPESLEAAVDALRGGPATVVAGGTDLMPAIRTGAQAAPEAWLSLHRITELGALRREPDGRLHLGALVTHADLASAPVVRRAAEALADAARLVGGPATRTLGTIGGNVVRASPAMDLGAPLLVLGARVALAGGASPSATRELPLAAFLLGPGRTALGADELLTAVLLPASDTPGAPAGSAYVRLAARGAMEVAVVGAAAQLVLDASGTRIACAAVALTAVGPTPTRAPTAEAVLVGAEAGEAAWHAAGEAAAHDAEPRTDLRAPEAYRRAMVAVAVRRALARAHERAVGAGEAAR